MIRRLGFAGRSTNGSLSLCFAIALLVSTAASLDAQPAWTSLGPEGGGVHALAVDPNDSSTLYAATDGGLFTSSDGGSTWVRLTLVTSPLAPVVHHVAVDPTNPSIVYAASDAGFLRSDDGGVTWERRSNVSAPHDLLIDPVTPSTIYASSTGVGVRVYRSEDSGSTWTPADTGVQGIATQLAMHPLAPSTLYLGTMGFGVYRSVNGGQTWVAAAPLPAVVNTANAVAVGPLDPDVLYVIAGGSVYRSADAGEHWAPAGSGLQGTLFTLVVDPTTPSTVYATSDAGLYRTENSGGSWQRVSNGISFGVLNTLVIDPLNASTLYVANRNGGEGVYRSLDGGQTWAMHNAGLVAQSFDALATDASAQTLYAGGALDPLYRSRNGGSTWTPITDGLGLTSVSALVLNPSNPAMVYAGGVGSQHSLCRSDDAGDTWTGLGAGLTGAVNVLAIDPEDPSVLHAGTSTGIFRTTNSGANWTLVQATASVLSLAVDATNPSIVYAGTLGGAIYRSSNRGADWTNLRASGDSIYALSVHPSASSTVLAGTVGGVLRSTDSGQTWALQNTGMSRLPIPVITAIAFDPLAPSQIYASNINLDDDLGAYLSADGGSTWSKLDSGLHHQVRALAVGVSGSGPSAKTTIFAATLGASIYVLQPATKEPPMTVADSYETVAGGQLTIGAPGVLTNDDSRGGGAMSAELIGNPAHGSLSLVPTGGFTYTPHAGFEGVDVFTYRAVTNVGPGNESTVSITVRGAAAGAPAPTGLFAYAVVGELVVLRWTMPTGAPAPTDFLVEGGLNPGEVLASFHTGSTAHTYAFSAPSGSFYVRVRAQYGGMASAPSNEIRIHVNVPVPPSAPDGLVGLVQGTNVTLAWRNTFEGGSPLAFWLDVTGDITTSLPLGFPGGDTVSFSNVPHGTYMLSLRAVGSGGTSPPSNSVMLTIPQGCSGPPLPPRNLFVYHVGLTAFADWAPASSGSAPTQYIVHVSGSFTGAIPTLARSVSGAVAPGSYSVAVQAVNACGASAITAPATLVVP